jgi:hypothetical protein
MTEFHKIDWKEVDNYSKEDLLKCVKLQRLLTDTLIAENHELEAEVKRLKQSTNIPIVIAIVVFAVYLLVR